MFLRSNPTPTHRMKPPSARKCSQVTGRVHCLCGTLRRHKMTFIAKTFYDLKATTLEGQTVDFNVFRGTTTRDYSELNQLQSKYPHRLVVLGFPCNQFGYQENCANGEILNSLKHVRPGAGFEPGFTIFEKCNVNGANPHPVFAYLKDKLPYPDDDPNSLMQDPKHLVWTPICRNDISWNFEKFVVGPEGEPFKRYSKTFPTISIEPDIQRLLRLTKT
ncbi:Glutathione peroxidase 2 [Merluccius polli]|uniref:Glutathione peroxidase n=1 Tax=Merluccius polli TaxID=89951 RepID=A0AA47N4F4_MERPO|nr:Glutathione peroxidase 2 [Merluccius polli]